MTTEQETGRGGPSRPSTSPFFRHWWVWLVVAAVLTIVLYFYVYQQPSRGKQAAPPVRPVPVAALPAKKGDIGVYITGLGTVTSLNTVTVKTRVDGELLRVGFREGDSVRKGDIIAEIDPRPFQVQLTQAEGALARDMAQLKNARVDLDRFQVLAAQDSIARQQRDTQEALVRQLEGVVKSDQGQIAAAKLQLVYSRIVSPLTGRVGLRQVDPGNIVHTTDSNGLVVITQLAPITVIFPIPEDNLPQVLAGLRRGERMVVEAWDREFKQKLAVGNLLTADNQVDTSTGTVRLKAVFSNQKTELFPNQFVNARLLVEVKRDAVIVPASAIQRGPQGTFVYVVKADQTVTVRPVTPGVTEGGNTSISAGLNAGEIVVVDGAERLREGSKVEAKQPTAGRSRNGGVSGAPQSQGR